MKHSLFQVVMPLCVAAVGAVTAQAANVPSIWNAQTVAAGAYIEYFDALPDWASDQSLVAETITASPRFYAQQTENANKVLAFSTDEVLTNPLRDTGTSEAPVASQTSTVYVEMRCKITPFTDDVTPDAGGSYKVMLFVDKDSNFVAMSPGCDTQKSSGVTASADTYYFITVRFTPEAYLVTISSEDGQTKLTEFTFSRAEPQSYPVQSVCFSGTGKVDDIFASYGDPSRASAYVAPAAPATGGTAEDQAINSWVANQFASNDRLVGANSASLAAAAPIAYLVNEKLVVGSDKNVKVPSAALKVGSFDGGKVSLNLTVDQQAKNGAINGVIKFKAARTYADATAGNWEEVTIEGVTKDFASGTQQIDFSQLIASGYRFFKPVVVADTAPANN